MNDRKESKIYRLLPCHKNDILAVEAWLENMAAEGYMLKKFKWVGAEFVECEPANVRFCILLAPENKLIHTDGISAHDSFVALQKNNGWEYLVRYEDFSVFVSDDAQIEEPDRNFDGWVQRYRGNMKWAFIMSMLLIGGLLLWLAIKDTLTLLIFMQVGTHKLILLLIVAELIILTGYFQKMRGVKKFLRSNLSEKVDWRENDRWNKVRNVCSYFVSIALIVVFIVLNSMMGVSHRMIPLENNKYPISIPLVEDFVSEDSKAQNKYKTYVYEDKDLLAPTILEISQRGGVDFGEKTVYGVMMHIEYHETYTSWLAVQIAKDHYKMDKASYKQNGFDVVSMTMLELPDLGVDYANAYWCGHPVIVLAEGNKVLHIDYYSPILLGDLSVDTVAQIYADYLLNENSETK